MEGILWNLDDNSVYCEGIIKKRELSELREIDTL